MTNDTSTLNGSLLEMKDQLIYELGQKGVTASYDSTTGLLGLIGRISDIQQGGGSCYHIEFSEDSYVAVGGTATLEIMLQENYAPKSGATVTITGSDSSLYTGLTDSTGVATVTVNVSADTTFTASYSNVSANCTVTVPTVLFEDACSSADGLSNYGAIRAISSSTTTSQLEYNSTNNAYYVHANGDWGIIPINALNGLEDYKITAEFKTKNSGNTYQGGLGFIAQNSTNNIIFRKYGTSCNSIINTSSQSSIGTTRTASSYWHKFEITKQGKNFSITVTDMDSGVVIGTQTRTVTFDPYYCGLMVVAGSNYGSYVRNIKAEPL